MAHAHGFDEGSKVSRIKQWEQVERSSGVAPASLLDKPNLDEDLAYLWHMFIEIRRGCEKIGFIEIDAYSRVTGVELSSWECSLMIEVDEAWRNNG